MASPTRGALKIALGAGALYFLVMRNLDSFGSWYSDRYLERMQHRDLARSLAREKYEMMVEKQNS